MSSSTKEFVVEIAKFALAPLVSMLALSIAAIVCIVAFRVMCLIAGGVQ